MSGSVELTLWLPRYKLDALSAVLREQGASVEERMQEVLNDLYAELVSPDVQQEIRTRIDEEYTAEQQKIEAEKKYTVLCVREDGTDRFFQLEHREDFLEIGKFLRQHLQKGPCSGTAEVQKFFPDLAPVSAERYGQMIASRLEDRRRVTGIFELDFDRSAISAVDDADGWQTYRMKDVSDAVYHAYRKNFLLADQYEARLQERLAGRQIPSAGHLSAREISFAEEICEVNGLLNFYMETGFDVDAVFGTHVCTAENDDWINVYANYDMAAGQVCDTLEIVLNRGDGSDTALYYTLNAVEKLGLLRKMDAYCQQQSGQTLVEYSRQQMAEEMAPPDRLTM